MLLEEIHPCKWNLSVPSWVSHVSLQNSKTTMPFISFSCPLFCASWVKHWSHCTWHCLWGTCQKKCALLQFPFHFAFLGPSRESQYDPLHTLSPGVCTSCLSPDETNEAATWWPTLHHWIHPPKTNGWNLKMMISKAGSSFSWGVHFQVNQPLVFGGVHKTETLSCWRPKNWRCQASFPLRLLKVDPPQDRNRWKENLFAKISWNSNETSNYSESSKLFKKFTRSQTGPVSPWGIS